MSWGLSAPGLVARKRKLIQGVGAGRARHLCHLTHNSASCERVFSLLKQLFGEQQINSLADLLQASLMLNYNKRVVG